MLVAPLELLFERFVVVLPVQRCNAFGLFLGKSGIIGSLRLGNLIRQLGLVGHVLLVIGVHFFVGLHHFQQQTVSLGALRLKLRLLLVKLLARRSQSLPSAAQALCARMRSARETAFIFSSISWSALAIS